MFAYLDYYHPLHRKIESWINYQGLDNNDDIHLLSDDWLEINFKERFPKVYEKILSLKPEDIYFTLPCGSRDIKTRNFPFENIKNWTEIQFVQENEPSCVMCSITSAMYYLQYFDIVYKIFEVYHYLNQANDYLPKGEDVVDILRNKYRNKEEKKLIFNILKFKTFDTDDVLEIRTKDIYYCFLKNRHVVAMTCEFIFDSEFERTLPRTRAGLRVSSESEIHEPIEDAILYYYIIQRKQYSTNHI